MPLGRFKVGSGARMGDAGPIEDRQRLLEPLCAKVQDVIVGDAGAKSTPPVFGASAAVGSALKLNTLSGSAGRVWEVRVVSRLMRNRSACCRTGSMSPQG